MDEPTVPGYVLIEQVGAGASGVVWRARRDSDGRQVALKVVGLPTGAESLVGGADQVAAELGLMQAHASDHIVRCHEAIALRTPTPAVALAMDFMEGGSLADVLAARGHLSMGETVTVVSPIARALATLHASGVVHGDVSPGNVLFDRSGRPSLSDLGVARAVGDRGGGVYGTPGFAAPELELGSPATPSSDVYSLGAVAWTCLTGAPPAVAALRPRLETQAPGLPAAARELVVACLAGDPGGRPSALGAALGFFDAAAAEPIRLVTAHDDLALLTRRIRAAAVADEQGAAAPERRRRVWPRGVWPRGAWRPGVWRPGVGPQAVWWPRAPAALGRWAAVAALLIGLTAALGWHRLASAQSVAPSPKTAGASAGASAVRSPTPQGILADQARLTADPVGVIRALSELRARAWTAGEEGLLAACDAPGSPALAHDRELLAQARRGGATYTGVGFRVVSATLEEVTDTRARLVARVDPTAYELAVHGRVTHVPARASPPVEFQLRWAGRQWMVEEVRAVTEPS
ncbi:MAG TPA: serine/threonine-protein kinase [Dermatophilaceae bacterium]|nr:serine/threonine-protein kinase [Dermatophilaceae bacterium]